MNDNHDTGSPAQSINLSIANLQFNISSPKLRVLSNYDPSYKQFLTASHGLSPDCIDVSLQLKKAMPDIADLPRIFETPETWYMLSDSIDKYIVFQPPNNPNIPPAWVAKIDSDQHKIDIFCDTKKLTNESNMEFIDNPVRYPLDQILLIHCLLGDGLLIHSAGIVIEDKGYLFAGPSGAGKSTVCSLFQEIGINTILSDDRMVVRKSGQDFLMYGTPWAGDAGIAVNKNKELHGVFFLKHSSENSIRKLTPQESLDKFFKVASLPWYDEKDLQESFNFCDDLLRQVKMYELNFRPGPEIVEDIMSFVSG